MSPLNRCYLDHRYGLVQGSVSHYHKPDRCCRGYRNVVIEASVLHSKTSVALALRTASILGIEVGDSGLVVLMSGHFGSRLLCHLTSQLFYKKGHSMRSYRHTHTQRVHTITTAAICMDPALTVHTTRLPNALAYLAGFIH